MLIDNVEAFKSWLTRNLAPICDADPAALARYVVALVKKDKAESELREICADQLEVFLQEKTKDFVNTLFSTLADKTYVSLADSSSAISGTSGLQISNSGPTDTTKPDIPRRTTEESGQENREPGNRRTRNSPSRSPVRPDVIIRDDKRRRPDDARRRLEPERRGYRGRDFPARRRSPGRSRSRSGSRSRNRSRGRSRSRSFSRSRSRSPRSRSRSWSRDRARRYESDSRGSTPIQDHGDKDYRVPAANGAAIPPANSNPPLLGPHPDARDQWARDRPPPRPRCRDYDEKGFCMRGDLCPFDHGNDPVVVEDVNLPNVLAFPQGPGPGPGPIPPHHGPPPMHGPPGPPRGPPGPPHGPPRVPPGPPRGPPGPQRGPPGQSHGPPMPPRHTRPPAQSGPIPHRPHSPHRGGPFASSRQQTPPPPGTTSLIHHPLPPDLSEGSGPPTGPPPNAGTGFQEQADSYNPEPYNPEAPQMRNHNQQYWGGSQRAPRTTGPPFQQHSQRALVSVPTVPEDPPLRDSQDASSFSRGGRGRGSRGRGFHGNQMGSNRTVIASKRPYEDTQDAGEKVAQIKPNPDRRLFPSSSEQPPQKRPGFDFSRLGPKRGNYNSENTTLEVRKIPKEMNNITKLNEHFSKFGHIINLQTCFGGDFEAALVTFLTNAQANAAYRSSEPVFNNRFIKVFWHKDKVPEGENSPQKPTQSTGESNTTEDKRIAVRDRVGNIPPPHKLQLNNTLKGSTHEKSVVVSPTGQLTKTVFNPAAVKSLPPAAHVSQILAASDKKKQEQKLQDAMKRKIEIQKQKQQLLQKYIQQQKLLIEKIEKNKTMGPDDKRLVMKTIKMLADNIEKLKKELTSGSTTPTVSPTGPKTKQQTQKEILDAELDIMMKTNEGVDTSQLKRRVALLKQELQAEALGLTSSTSRGRGRGRGRGTTWSRGGRRRKLSASQLTVDRRPKQLLVTGFDAEAKDELSAHFSNLAEVEKVEIDDHIPNAIVTFKTRSDAEQVVSYGQVFKGKKMVLGWYSPQAAAASQAVKSPVSPDAPVPVSAVPPASNKVLVDQLETITVTVDTGMVEEEPSLDVEDQDQELNDLDEDLLLGVDDEDEDEEEGRSWRR